MGWPWVGRAVGDLDVRAVVYHVSDTNVSALVVGPDGTSESAVLASLDEVLPMIDAVADGLQRTTDVARGKVRALREFAGSALLPRSIAAQPPDVVVIVPHSLLHGVPLHLIHTDTGEPLCTVSGVTYASSLSQFMECADRNPNRRANSSLLSADSVPSQKSVAGYSADVLDWQEDRFTPVMDGIASALGHYLIGEGSRGSIKGHLDPWNEHAPHIDALVITAHGYIDPDEHQLSGMLLSASDQIMSGMRAGATLRPVILAEEHPTLMQVNSPMTLPPPELGVTRYSEVLSIAEMRMDTLCRIPLIALLGCSAGWSRILKGDVPSSFGEVFLTLGAATVIAPGWDAEVAATARWAELFFEAWARFEWPAALAGAYATRTLYEESFPVERYGAITLRGDWL